MDLKFTMLPVGVPVKLDRHCESGKKRVIHSSGENDSFLYDNGGM